MATASDRRVADALAAGIVREVRNEARELDRRTSNGSDVRLLWDGADVLLALSDDTGDYLVRVPNANAADAFRHPYFYLRGVYA